MIPKTSIARQLFTNVLDSGEDTLQNTMTRNNPLLRRWTNTSNSGDLRRKWTVSNTLLVVTPILLLCITLTGVSSWTLSLGKPVLCETARCKAVATALNFSMNTEVAACDNFYRYVCDRWFEGRSRTEELQAKVAAIMNFAWEEHPLPTVNQTPIDKVVAIYRSCRKSFEENATNLDALHEFLSELDLPWPGVDNANNL